MRARELSQEVKDALADAETLASITRRAHSRKGWTHTQLYRAAAYGWTLQTAIMIDGANVRFARLAARAAFRAVPALREE